MSSTAGATRIHLKWRSTHAENLSWRTDRCRARRWLMPTACAIRSPPSPGYNARKVEYSGPTTAVARLESCIDHGKSLAQKQELLTGRSSIIRALPPCQVLGRYGR